jgi:excisionase family DNA binding protein
MENWLTVKEAAPAARMSEQALYAAIREKQFPAIRIGRRIRIDPAALREWIARGGTPAQSEASERDDSK